MSVFKVVRANALYEIFEQLTQVLSDNLCPLKKECSETGWEYKHNSHSRTWSFRYPKDEVSAHPHTILIETISTDGLGLNCIQVHRMYYSTEEKLHRDRIVWCFVISDRCTVSEITTDGEAIGHDPNPFFQENLTKIFNDMGDTVSNMTLKLSKQFCFDPKQFTVGDAYRLKAISVFGAKKDDDEDADKCKKLACGITAIFAGFSPDNTIAYFKQIRQDEFGDKYVSDWSFTREDISKHDIRIIGLTAAEIPYKGWCIGWENKINVPDIIRILYRAWINMLHQNWMKFIAPDCWQCTSLSFTQLDRSARWGGSESVYHIDTVIESDGESGTIRLQVQPKFGNDKPVNLLQVNMVRLDRYPSFETRLSVTFPHVNTENVQFDSEEAFFDLINNVCTESVQVIAEDHILAYVDNEEDALKRIGEAKLDLIKRFIIEPIERLYVMKG